VTTTNVLFFVRCHWELLLICCHTLLCDSNVLPMFWGWLFVKANMAFLDEAKISLAEGGGLYLWLSSTLASVHVLRGGALWDLDAAIPRWGTLRLPYFVARIFYCICEVQRSWWMWVHMLVKVNQIQLLECCAPSSFSLFSSGILHNFCLHRTQKCWTSTKLYFSNSIGSCVTSGWFSPFVFHCKCEHIAHLLQRVWCKMQDSSLTLS
jgi:hypothetical protein